jgi:predicted 3-demethylubiquinone-9 3-methyltransferase (glyoxalase superfamily)
MATVSSSSSSPHISPFLWFNDQAYDAALYYTSIFKNSKITSIMKGPEDKILGVNFTLNGTEIKTFNGGPTYTLTPAISLFVECETQEEIDMYWDKLLEGGTPMACGWLFDKYGLCWQIIPKILGELYSSGDAEKVQRVYAAMNTMIKMDLQKLKDA